MHASGVAIRRVTTKPEGDRRVEVAAGDVRERGHHHRDREPLRDRDPDQPAEPTMIAPPAKKTSVKVPMNSAVPRRR